MKRTVLIFMISLFCLLQIKSKSGDPSVKPNILLIITDQQSSGALSCTGNPFVKTPALDELASTGIRFEKNYVSQPLCLPCRSSLQTGRYPHEIGAVSNQKKITGSFPMLGNLVASAGYNCDYLGKWHVGTTPEIAGYNNYDNVGTDDKKAEAAVEYLLTEHEKPFFLTVSFMNPHNVCELARADADGTDLPDGPIGLPPSDPDELPPLPHNFNIPENVPSVIRKEQKGSTYEYPTTDWNEITWRRYLWGYYRLVEKVDAEIGKVLNALQEGGYAENTVVIFTSDHGEGLAMRHWNQKKVLYDQVTRVPLIINWKGKTKHQIYTELVSNAMDIPVTILDITGVDKPESMHGYSLLPIIENRVPKPREYVVSETTFNEDAAGNCPTGRMLRTKRFKYCIYSEGKNREQLFDMENDPGEINNLVDMKEFTGELKRHRKLISEWARSTNDIDFPYFNQESVFQFRIDDQNAVYLRQEDFALHGDGIGDDAPALQEAINLVEQQSTNGNGIVFIPEGTYRLGKTVYLWRGIRLIGYGKTRPVFMLGNNTPGFQDGSGNYMIHFCDRRSKEGEPVNDAANTTYFSGINNINFVIEKGNPAAVAVRFHVAQHCALKNIDFHIGSALAGVEDMGNLIESCNFYDGKWGIKTGMTSPGWQALVLDCSFKSQKTASIQTEDAGMTIIRCKFYDEPKAILVPSGANERLYVKDCLFENISQPAINVNKYFIPLTQVNLENLIFKNVPVSLEYYGGFGHGTSRTVPIPDEDINGTVSYQAPGPVYRINDYCHGLIIESTGSELKREFNTINDQEQIEMPGDIPEKDFPSLPAQEKWVNILELGAKGDGETDDTEIFKRAIKKFSTIYIPMGNYLLSETLTLKEQTAIIGLHPSRTRLCLNPNTPGFNNPEKPLPLLVSPKGGSNIITGIGFYVELNPGVIAVKWMAGSESYINDTFFSWSKRSKKGEGEYYGLWVTDGGGGTFKNIWAANQQGRNGLFISNTSTEGRIYEISVEHHKEVEVKLDNMANWNFYNLQSEEDGGSEKSIAVDINNCSNLKFANNLSYRVKVMQTPAVAAFEINNSNDIIIKGSHVFSWGSFPYDNTVYIKDRDQLVPQHDFTRFILN